MASLSDSGSKETADFRLFPAKVLVGKCGAHSTGGFDSNRKILGLATGFPANLGCRGRGGRKVPISGGNLQGQRGEVVTAVPRDRKRSGPADGRQPSLRSPLPNEPGCWNAGREPDITLCALLAELAKRGIKISRRPILRAHDSL
jgi:hypothetical protein